MRTILNAKWGQAKNAGNGVMNDGSPRETTLSPEEGMFYSALQAPDAGGPTPAQFLAALPAAHAEVLHRLALGLMREGVLDARVVGESGASTQYVACVGDLELYFEFSGDGPFSRYPRLEACHAVAPDGSRERIERPLDLYSIATTAMNQDYDLDAVATLKHEIDNGVANLALCIAAGRVSQSENAGVGISSLRSWLAQFDGDADARRRALEREVRTGHRLHVCSKTRMGMSPSEALAFAPELTHSAIQLRWVAVRKRALQYSGRYAGEIFADLWPAPYAEAQRELGARVEAANDYELIPMHPWQAAHAFENRIVSSMEDKDAVLLESTALAFPQLSLRTVEPVGVGRPPAFHCKLPIGVQTTSAERTVSPQSVWNGPRISEVFDDIVAQGNVPLNVVREVAGISLDPSYRNIGGDIARHLGILVRENPSATSTGHNEHWLCSALCAKPSFGTDSLISQWVRLGYRRHGNGTMLHAWIQEFWRSYCQALLGPSGLMLGKYGVALEAHSQNTLMDFDEQGMPARLSVRDFGGVRIHLPTLRESGHDIEFFADSATESGSWGESVSKFLHTVFQMHLTDALQALTADGLQVEAPWKVALDVLEGVYREHGLADAWGRDSPMLCAPTIKAKCLLLMRVMGVYRDYEYQPVANPLADVG